MQIKLTERANECSKEFKELTQEMEDYNNIVMCIKALQAVANNPNRFTYSKDDYDKVVERLYKLCEKHEVMLPTTDYVEWNAIEIV